MRARPRWTQLRLPLAPAAVTSESRSCSDGRRLRTQALQVVPRQHQQVETEDRSPHVALERLPGLPTTAIETEDPLQERDIAFDSCPKLPQPLVHPSALDHGTDLQTNALGERDILHPRLFDVFQVELRGKRPIEDNLPWRPSKDVGLAIDHHLGQRRVRGIALQHSAIENHRGSTAGEADLVTEQRLPAILADDVGVRLEDRDDLLCGRHALSFDDPPTGLADHLLHERQVVVESIGNAHDAERLGGVQLRGDLWLAQQVANAAPSGMDLFSDGEQVAVSPLPVGRLLGVEDPHAPSLGTSRAIAEGHQRGSKKLARLAQQPCDDTHAVPQQLGVTRLMDVGVDHRAVHAHLAAGLHLGLLGSAEDDAMNGLQGLRPKGLEVRVERRLRRYLVEDPQAAEGTIAARIGEMKGQYAIAEAVHLFDDEHPQHLLGAQSSGTTRDLRAVASDAKVLQDQLLDPRMVVEELRDGLELGGMIEIEPDLTQAGLSFAGFTHSGWPLFPPKLFGISGLSTLILHNLAGKSQPGCGLNLFPSTTYGARTGTSLATLAVEGR